jgi:hypothetical protein
VSGSGTPGLSAAAFGITRACPDQVVAPVDDQCHLEHVRRQQCAVFLVGFGAHVVSC